MVKLTIVNTFTYEDQKVHFRCILKFPTIPNFLGAVLNQQLTMAPLLSLKHAYAIQQISRKSLKSIKIIYYL